MENKTPVKVQPFSSLIDTIARFESFKVGNKEYTAELLISQLTINTKDLLVETSTCSAHILYWGVELARAKKYYELTDAAYRSWRDKIWYDFKKTGNEGGKSPSDTLCEKYYRSLPEYSNWQSMCIQAQEAVDCSQAVLEAFRAKSHLIKVQEQLLRDEAGGAYYVVE